MAEGMSRRSHPWLTAMCKGNEHMRCAVIPGLPVQHAQCRLGEGSTHQGRGLPTTLVCTPTILVHINNSLGGRHGYRLSTVVATASQVSATGYCNRSKALGHWESSGLGGWLCYVPQSLLEWPVGAALEVWQTNMSEPQVYQAHAGCCPAGLLVEERRLPTSPHCNWLAMIKKLHPV